MSFSIKLMADYSAFPVWDRTTGRNLRPADLPISVGLQNDLAAWASRFETTLNVDDARSSRFQTGEELHIFDDQGIQLWRRLQAELGESARVTYFSSIERKEIETHKPDGVGASSCELDDEAGAE